MAHRLLSARSALDPRRITLPQPKWSDYRSVGPAAWRAARRQVSGVALRDLIWQLIWLPYWVGSDVPAPSLPRREPAPSVPLGPAGAQVLTMLDSMIRRLWLHWALSMIVRGIWLAAAVGCVWLIAERFGAPAVSAEPIFWLAVILAGIGALFGLTLRPTRRRTAQMLDRSFALHERIGTAYASLGHDVPQPGERPSVVYLQVADSANIIAELRKHPAFSIRPPVREIVLGITIGLLLAALSFYRGAGGDIPPSAAASVPQFVPASQRIAEQASQAAADQTQNVEGEMPSLAEIEEMARRSNEAEQNLGTLGSALEDHAMTRSAADNIAEGDYPAAADDLRAVGDNADAMSPEARAALADDLDAAADQMTPGDQELADASRQAADGMREGGEAAAEGMDNLANEVEQTGSDVVDQQELAQQRADAEARESRAGSSSESSDSTSQPGSQSDPQSGQSGEQNQNQPQSGQQGEPGEPSEAQAGGEGGESAAAGDQVAAAPDEETAGGTSEETDGQEGGEQPGSEAGSEGESGSGGDQATEQERGPNAPGATEGGEGQEGSDSTEAGGTTMGGGQPLSGDQAAAPPDDAQPPPALPAAERVSGPDDATGQQPGEAPEQDQEGVVSLSGSGGAGVQTGNNPGETTSGSGSGSTTGTGWATQGEVGEPGPDSNRVPPEYRDVVEDYFTTPRK